WSLRFGVAPGLRRWLAQVDFIEGFFSNFSKVDQSRARSRVSKGLCRAPFGRGVSSAFVKLMYPRPIVAGMHVRIPRASCRPYGVLGRSWVLQPKIPIL